MKAKNLLIYVMMLSLFVVFFIPKQSFADSSVTTVYTASKDYSGVQGKNQWYYQKLSNSVYTDLSFDSLSNRWVDKDLNYLYISSNGMYVDLKFDSVRKWVSPGKGTISISGTIFKEGTKGDGVIITLKVDSKVLWTTDVKTNIKSKIFDKISVVKGTTVYFMINKRSSIDGDYINWDPTVTYVGEYPSDVEQTPVPTATPISTPVETPTPSPTPIVETPSPSPVEDKTLSVVDFGAIPNDNKDDYSAFVACLNEAKKQNKIVYVPEGNFTLSKILTLNGVSLNGAGSSLTTLTSTNAENGSIDIKGENVTLSNIKHVYQTVVPRGNGANEKNSITVRGAKNFNINNVYVYKASTAGILVQGISNGGVISNNIVESTNADGIHITDSSSNIVVQNNVVKSVGDDTIAVVSYKQDGPAVHDVIIKNNDVGYNSQARGISVVGGVNITIEGNSIKETQMAGIYIAVEGNYNTTDVDQVLIDNNVIDYTGIREPANHPNLLVYSSSGTIDNVIVSNNIIKNAAHRGIGVWGSGTIKDVYFIKNTLINKVGANTTFEKGTIHLEDNIGF